MSEGSCSVDVPSSGCTGDTMGNAASNFIASTSYRPRGSLARALYEKQQADSYLSRIDKSQWYACDLSVLPDDLAYKFVQLEADEDTAKFLKKSEEKSDWILTQVWHTVAKVVLGWFMTQTSINGWLRRGSMFVLSLEQFLKLINEKKDVKLDSMLDLGAGDGEVTAHLESVFNKVYVTEVSKTMQALLEKRGYELLQLDNWYEDRKYDAISCLNLLDRCDKPLELLEQIHNSLLPSGFLLLAIVFPFSPYVESGSADHRPKEMMHITGRNFEEQFKSFVNNVINPMKFTVVSWTRVPYLCEGDLKQSYYWLDDCVMVLRPV